MHESAAAKYVTPLFAATNKEQKVISNTTRSINLQLLIH